MTLRDGFLLFCNRHICAVVECRLVGVRQRNGWLGYFTVLARKGAWRWEKARLVWEFVEGSSDVVT